ncbi:hypothetical protein Vretifemale_12736, partial [Volvox reticuliferus]
MPAAHPAAGAVPTGPVDPFGPPMLTFLDLVVIGQAPPPPLLPTPRPRPPPLVTAVAVAAVAVAAATAACRPAGGSAAGARVVAAGALVAFAAVAHRAHVPGVPGVL